MRGILTIARRELQSYFYAPLAYVVAMVFLFIVGLFFVGYVEFYSEISMRAAMNPAMGSQANVDDVIIRNIYATFGVIMIFVAPILTMRALSEERRLRTAELLLTAPVTTWQIVLGKYLGALGFAAFMLLLTLVFPLYLYLMEVPPEAGVLLAVYLGALLTIGAFLSIGVFTSSLTSSQIVAALVGFVLCLFFWMVGSLASIGNDAGGYAALLKAISISDHYQDFLRGVIDTSAVVFFLTFIAFGLFLTNRVVDSSRWR